MSRNYSRILDSLEAIKPNLLQVVSYETFELRCAIILDTDPPHLLDGLNNLRTYTIKNRLAFPLLVNRKFVENSLDVFPLEFLDITSSNYQSIYCKEDLLSKLQFAKSDVLLQMERELKSKLLLTRLTVLEASPKPKILAAKLQMAIQAITPVLKGFCYCADSPIPQDFPDLLAQVQLITNIELKQMGEWVKMEKVELFHIKNFLEILQNLINYMEADQ